MYTKEQQLKNNKPKKTKVPFGSKPTKWNNSGKKPKQMKHKSNATAEDKEYLNWAKEQNLNCFICNKKNGIELHHIKEYSMQKKNHREILPVCGIECHRLGKFSIHGNSKWFIANYPIEMQREYASALYSKYEAIIKN